MSPTAVVIAVSYAVVSLVGIGVFLLVWRSTKSRGPVDAALLAKREKGWLVALVLALTALLLGTIFFTPYGESAPPGSQVVNVEAQQFAFKIDPGTIRAGEPVELRLTSSDVNHGFGVYTQDDELVLQAQVVPDGVTNVVHTFDDPGVYKVLCLEYCGLDHHGMVSQLEVVP